MRITSALALLASYFLLASISIVRADESLRQTVDLNRGWKFIRQDAAGAEQPSFDDAAWIAISLPHTWNNLDGEGSAPDYYRGIGWYRRHLDLSQSNLAGKSLFIYFDGASKATDVFVNGTSAGPTHQDMFGAFCYDITSLLNISGDNVIAVRCNNANIRDIPPESADFTFFGGIYRGVHLLVTNPLAITPLDYASPGVYLKELDSSPRQASVEVTTKVRNAASSDQTATVHCALLDSAGNVVAQSHRSMTVAAGTTTDFIQNLVIDNPHLWNGRKDPYLYQARVTVSGPNGPTDEVTQPLGLRSFSVDPDRGFILNGQPYSVHGVNRHQDRQDVGWAITSKEQKEDFDLIMEMGCTGIRLAHYQHAQEFYDLCDRGGLVVWAEACLVNRVVNSPQFDQNAETQLRELIKQNYNHPSICFWSLYNELGNERVSPAQMAAQNQHQIDLVRQLDSIAHVLDPTRPTTAAISREASNPLNLVPDLLSFNRYDGWYSKTAADWPATLDGLRAALPGRPIAISEYGAGASVREHELSPKQPITKSAWHPEEWQCIVHEQAYGAMKQRPWLWGTFLWNMFDFASAGRREGDHAGINDKGLVTYDRKIKKDAFYFYKANWSDEPFVHINDSRFTPRNVAGGPVKIYSNCDSVELALNGVSLGSKETADHIFIWPDVTLKEGTNDLSATATRGGRTFSDVCGIVFDPNCVPYHPTALPTQ